MFYKKDNLYKTYNLVKSKLNLIEKKKEFKDFFINIKNTFTNNKELKNIIIKYYNGEEITESDNKLLKTIIIDNLKIVGLGSLSIVSMPIPGSTFLILILIKGAQKLGIDLRPSEFIKESNENNNIDITKMSQNDWAELQYQVIEDCFSDMKLKILPVKLSTNRSFSAVFKSKINTITKELIQPMYAFNKSILWTNEKLKNVMAHEMIHYYLCTKGMYREGHGIYFQSQMNRINSLNNGYKVTLKDDEFNLVISDEDKNTTGGYLIIMRALKHDFFSVLKDYKNIDKLIDDRFKRYCKIYGIKELVIKELTKEQIKNKNLSINRGLKLLSFKNPKLLGELDNETKYVTKIQIDN